MAEGLVKKELLHLIACNRVEIKEKENSDPNAKIVKYKYEFLTEDGGVKTGWLDTDKLAEYVEGGVEKFDEAKAHTFTWQGRVWNQETSWRLTDAKPE